MRRSDLQRAQLLGYFLPAAAADAQQKFKLNEKKKKKKKKTFVGVNVCNNMGKRGFGSFTGLLSLYTLLLHVEGFSLWYLRPSVSLTYTRSVDPFSKGQSLAWKGSFWLKLARDTW